jgi:CO/xanthine dehydrogenase Mo-binding subunit
MYTTPRELARALGIPAYELRIHLRQQYGYATRGQWRLDMKMVLECVTHFARNDKRKAA